MNNFIYLGYYLLKTNYKDLSASLSCCRTKGLNVFRLIIDMVWSSLRYGSSFVDYFNFRFYEKDHQQRQAYATMGFMYKYHREINDQKKIKEVDSKELFPQKFGAWCNKSYVFSKDEMDQFNHFLQTKTGQKIVFKDPNSTAGKSINIVSVTRKENQLFIGNQSADDFIQQQFESKQSIYCEDFIQQHDAIQAISPTGVNTLRIISMVTKEKTVDIIAALFRISVNCPIDNYSAGNLAAEIDTVTGIVSKGGIRKRSACDDYQIFHPVTKMPIKGFQIPFWKEIIQMINEAALIVPEVRTIGWDVAITNTGPILIEGNSQWNKDTFQIPSGIGKKDILLKYK